MMLLVGPVEFVGSRRPVGERWATRRVVHGSSTGKRVALSPTSTVDDVELWIFNGLRSQVATTFRAFEAA